MPKVTEKPAKLEPTFTNTFIHNPHDAALLVQAVIDGTLNPVNRRPNIKERLQLIKSGNVFIFDEKNSLLRRWTDGITWTPSRVQGSFLIYRCRPNPTKKSKLPNNLIKKTICVPFKEKSFRIISYYKRPNNKTEVLLTPSQNSFFSGTKVLPELEPNEENVDEFNGIKELSTQFMNRTVYLESYYGSMSESCNAFMNEYIWSL